MCSSRYLTISCISMQEPMEYDHCRDRTTWFYQNLLTSWCVTIVLVSGDGSYTILWSLMCLPPLRDLEALVQSIVSLDRIRCRSWRSDEELFLVLIVKCLEIFSFGWWKPLQNIKRSRYILTTWSLIFSDKKITFGVVNGGNLKQTVFRLITLFLCNKIISKNYNNSDRWHSWH